MVMPFSISVCFALASNSPIILFEVFARYAALRKIDDYQVVVRAAGYESKALL